MSSLDTVSREYAGFWIRAGASIIDTVLMMLLTWPLMSLIYGAQYWESDAQLLGPMGVLISYALPALAIILFWVYRSATLGKILLKLIIVDAKTGGTPTNAQFVGRYLGYYASIIPFFAGFIWVGIDKRKQGFHDKLAGTLVIRGKKAAEQKTAKAGNGINQTPDVQSVERLH